MLDNTTSTKPYVGLALCPTMTYSGKLPPLLISTAECEGIVFDSDDPEDIVRWLHEHNETHE